jgi:hypothetical protein
MKMMMTRLSIVLICLAVKAAKSLSTRYNDKLGLIRSWDSYTFPIIIDNMMNLELLMWSARNSGGARGSGWSGRYFPSTIQRTRCSKNCK